MDAVARFRMSRAAMLQKSDDNSALNRVDLPAFVLPRMNTCPEMHPEIQLKYFNIFFIKLHLVSISTGIADLQLTQTAQVF